MKKKSLLIKVLVLGFFISSCGADWETYTPVDDSTGDESYLSVSREGGEYDEDITIEFINVVDEDGEDAEVIYTLDGSEPNPNDIGGTTFLYDATIKLTGYEGPNPGLVVLKAVSVKNGKVFGFMLTVTYVFTHVDTVTDKRVLYHGNGNDGGLVPIDEDEYRKKDSVVVLGNIGGLVKSGYSFTGWCDSEDCLGTVYQADGTLTIGDEDFNLYARWSINPVYRVFYYGNGSVGGAVPEDTIDYEENQSFTVLGNIGGLVKPGYSFIGWCDSEDCLGEVYQANETISIGNSNFSLYAKWLLIPTYVVTYYPNGAEGGSVPVDGRSYEEGAVVTVLHNTGDLLKEGYRLTGWCDSEDCSGAIYEANESFSMGPEDVDLYAKWVEKIEHEMGDQDSFSVSGVDFNMVYVEGGITFPTGWNDAGSNTVNYDYFIGETHVTCGLVDAVVAEISNQSLPYVFTSSYACGSDFTGLGKENHPVTRLSFYDAVVFTNALSDILGLDPVYRVGGNGAVITNSNQTTDIGALTDFSIHQSYNGFRLPVWQEWEFAARYRGSDSTNTVTGYTNPYFTKADSASGATADSSDEAATRAVAVYSGDPVGNRTQEVGSKSSNALGLYDMSGNAWQWQFNGGEYARWIRGGAWNSNMSFMVQISFGSSETLIGNNNSNHGLRLSRTAL